MNDRAPTRLKCRHLMSLVGLLLPILAAGQNYVFGPNIRVSSDPPGTAPHWTYSPGQHLITCRGDTAYLVWRGDQGGNSHIYFARSNDAGQSFGPNVRVDNTPSGCVGIMPSLAVDDSGGIHVCWLNYNAADNAFTYYARSTNGGQTFLPPVRACDSLHSAQYALPSIAVSKSGRYVFVVLSESWYDSFPPSTYQIKLSRSTDGGETFIAPNTPVLADTVAWILDPSVAVFNDTIVLVVCDSVTPPSLMSAILFTRSTDGGVSFQTPLLLSDTVSGPSDPSIATDSMGRVYVAWSGAGFTASTDTGRTFPSPWQPVNGGMNVSLWASRDGRLYLAWWFYRGYPYFYNVRFCNSTDGGQTFSQPVHPCDGPDSTWESAPTVCANEDARVFLAWEDNRNNLSGHNDDIYFATGILVAISESGPPPETKMVFDVLPNPARGRVRVSYSVPCPGRTRIEVLNLTGQHIAILKDAVEEVGRHTLTWNCSDAQGRPFPAGIYFLRMSTVSGAVTRRLVLLVK